MSAHPGNVDSVWVAGKRVKADGKLLDVDLAAVRRLVDASRDRVFAAAGASIGGDWLPRPYEETPSA